MEDGHARGGGELEAEQLAGHPEHAVAQPSELQVGFDLALIEVVDPASGSWTPTGSMSTARRGHVAVVLPSGKMARVRSDHSATLLVSGQVLVAGGTDLGSASTAELYDAGAGTWTSAGTIRFPRRYHVAIRLRSGRVLITGGNPVTTRTTIVSASAVSEVYDPATRTWSLTGGMTTARAGHTLNVLPSEKVLATGGTVSPGLFYAAYASSESFVPPP